MAWAKELEEKVHRLKALEKQHLANKEQIQRENHEALEKFVADNNKGIKAHLPILRSNLMLHAQVSMCPFNLRRLNFKCMRHLAKIDLSFDVLNSKGVVWKKFQRK
ncbi:hypothetical protein J1N35_001363 [Gossypium stocksii]|uniref:Uncharacterized protein n=1 Tax=Gossypium stocksii TaxID=47602 RepID=A0A9D3WIW9_9ROSI|nr:hypothetical protein J1N35_001363 [Gossypium stocksii]